MESIQELEPKVENKDKKGDGLKAHQDVTKYIYDCLSELGPKNSKLYIREIIHQSIYRLNWYASIKSETTLINKNQIVKSMFIKVLVDKGVFRYEDLTITSPKKQE